MMGQPIQTTQPISIQQSLQRKAWATQPFASHGSFGTGYNQLKNRSLLFLRSSHVTLRMLAAAYEKQKVRSRTRLASWQVLKTKTRRPTRACSGWVDSAEIEGGEMGKKGFIRIWGSDGCWFGFWWMWIWILMGVDLGFERDLGRGRNPSELGRT